MNGKIGQLRTAPGKESTTPSRLQEQLGYAYAAAVAPRRTVPSWWRTCRANSWRVLGPKPFRRGIL